jgi:hypothetical protein
MSDSRWPDFLIVGAAKAGTTALYHQLGTHPDIFMSPQKEMNFFALENQVLDFKGPGDMNGIHRTSITNIENYLSFFKGAKKEQVKGEVSPLYLYSDSAVIKIRKYVPNIKIIVCLRNPIDRAFSAFSHLIRDQREIEIDFLTAFFKNQERIDGGWAEIWHYGSMGLYANQLERYFSVFDKNQILILVYEKFLNDPQTTLLKICDFLMVDSSFNFDLEKKYNQSGSPRFQRLHQLLIRPHLIKNLGKIFMPKSIRTWVRENVINLNLKNKPSITPDQIQSIYPFFREDIRRTEALINIDLSHWKPK